MHKKATKHDGKLKLILVAGARPNFMKIAPIMRAIQAHNSNSENLIAPTLVHTGQHYDPNMSDTFFNDLGIPEPDYYLNCGGGTHAQQTAAIMLEFEKLCINEKPDIVLVVGDVNSTIAAGLVAKKLQIALAHVEAGLRSDDRSMPEEINRLATDAISDIFFTTEKSANENLLKEGHSKDSIHFVGHVMIDNLYFQLEKMKNYTPSEIVSKTKNKLARHYFCLTLHRPANVDNEHSLSNLINAISKISEQIPIIFPCHPRTRKQIQMFGLQNKFKAFDGNPITNGIYLYEPLGYNDFLYLWKDATGVITDSGGLQEETTALGIPCITVRENTERPITLEEGTNVLVGNNTAKLKTEAEKILSGNAKKGKIPEKWDGKAGERIVSILKKFGFFLKING